LTQPFQAEEVWERTRETTVDQVAAVCYRLKDNTLEFLLVQTNQGRWIFPKGNIEVGEELWETAQEEAFEEAGVSGEIQQKPFTTFLHFKQRVGQAGIELRVAAFLLLVKTTQPALEKSRTPTWFSLPEAEQAFEQNRPSQYTEELKRVIRQAATLFQENPSVSSVDPTPL